MTLHLDAGRTRGLLPALGLPAGDARALQLPVLTTAGDVREVVRYLRRKPAGVSVAEEMDRPRRRLFEARKLAAYELLGLLDADGDSVTLSPLGRSCARELEPEARVFRRLLEQTPAYRSALEWIHGQGLGVITTNDLVGFWRECRPEAVVGCDADLLRGAAVSFFSLCQAAGVGTMTLGKRGHITRLCVDQEELRALFDGEHSTLEEAGREEAGGGEGGVRPRENAAPASSSQARRRSGETLRVLVLAGGASETVSMLRRTLDLAGVESRLLEKDWGGAVSFEEDAARPAPDCDAALVVLDATALAEGADGRRSIREAVLIEIGAALVLYERRVVLLADEKFPPLEAVRDLHCYEVVNGGLSWEAGIRLLEAVERFKSEVGLGARR